ncbi:hypothetical protein ES703_120627 [subsurface metagenome]
MAETILMQKAILSPPLYITEKSIIGKHTVHIMSYQLDLFRLFYSLLKVFFKTRHWVLLLFLISFPRAVVWL